jgi:tetratricopeptide (TPR) repeat protein
MYLARGLEAMDRGDFLSAATAFGSAYAADGACLAALVHGGACLAELGRLDEAAAAFRRAVEVDAQGSALPYLHLAQLSEGVEARAYYETAVAVLRRQREAASPADREESDASLLGALCALAELHLTDLCYEPDAEARCEAYLDAALQVAETPAVLQLYGSVRISQGRRDDARALLLRAFALVRDAADPPPLPERAALAEMLVELDECAAAVVIFERLVAELDHIAELWYELAFAQARLGRAADARESLAAAVELLGKLPPDEADPELAHKVAELMAHLPPPDEVAVVVAADHDDDDDDVHDDDDDDDDEYAMDAEEE